jgi:hypothetical protein
MEAAWARQRRVLVGIEAGPRGSPGDALGGGAEGFAGAELGGDDEDGDFRLGLVLRQQVGDGGHGAFVADRARVGGVVGRRRKEDAEVGVDFAREGGWVIGNGKHGMAGRPFAAAEIGGVC